MPRSVAQHGPLTRPVSLMRPRAPPSRHNPEVGIMHLELNRFAVEPLPFMRMRSFRGRSLLLWSTADFGRLSLVAQQLRVCGPAGLSKGSRGADETA